MILPQYKLIGCCLFILAVAVVLGIDLIRWSNPEFEDFAAGPTARPLQRSTEIVKDDIATFKALPRLDTSPATDSESADPGSHFNSRPGNLAGSGGATATELIGETDNGYGRQTEFERELADNARATRLASQAPNATRTTPANHHSDGIVAYIPTRRPQPAPAVTIQDSVAPVRPLDGSIASRPAAVGESAPQTTQPLIQVVSSQSEANGPVTVQSGGDFDANVSRDTLRRGFSDSSANSNENSEPRIALNPGSFFEPATTSPTARGNGPTAALDSGDFLLASQPQVGSHFKDDQPQIDRRANLVQPENADFAPDPIDPYMPYDPGSEMWVYQGKTLNANQRPLVELGRPWYQLGQLPESSTILGAHNPVSPQFVIFGDYRSAYASNTQNGDNVSQLAVELNLFWNLQLTGTDRLVAFVGPLDNGAKNTSYFFDENVTDEELDFDFDFGYYEGDLGALVGGFVGETLPFDLPFTVGVIPLLVQNGVWMEDAFLGVAATIPARNSARFDISNMDITFFAGFDEIISDAFEGEDDAAKAWGVLSFIEALDGYWEVDYAFLEDRTDRDRSYHNVGLGYTRRYGRLLSNSTRVIVNAGQSTNAGPNTADGVLLISENSLITGVPSSIIPYFNFWAGFDRPQAAARAGAAGGVLRNTGILFESDGMTGFPTLDATAQDTFGGAIGINIMPNDWSQQLVLEMAGLGVMGNPVGRNANDNQYGLGVRYQLPLNNATILRADGMYGFLEGDEDLQGVRLELRRKF